MKTAPTISRVTFEFQRPGDDERRGTLPYFMHQAVADLFGDRPDRGYLFRLLREVRGQQIVLVLSDSPPLPPEQLPRRPHRRVVAVDWKPFRPELQCGQELDFEILVNATRTYQDAAGRHRRVDVWDDVWAAEPATPLTPHCVYRRFLQAKLSGSAEILEARVTERGEVRARRPGSAAAMSFIAANLAGRLRVDDPGALLATMALGLGRSRAFGCGLLCLSRPGTILPRRPSEKTEILTPRS